MFAQVTSSTSAAITVANVSTPAACARVPSGSPEARTARRSGRPDARGYSRYSSSPIRPRSLSACASGNPGLSRAVSDSHPQPRWVSCRFCGRT